MLSSIFETATASGVKPRAHERRFVQAEIRHPNTLTLPIPIEDILED